jgi:hypothetical protein
MALAALSLALGAAGASVQVATAHAVVESEPTTDIIPPGGGTEAVCPVSMPPDVSTDQIVVGPIEGVLDYCPVPNVSVWVDPQYIEAGGYTTISWTTDTGWGCNSSWAGTVGTNGSMWIGPFYSTTGFSLSCTNNNPQAGVGYSTIYVVAPPPPPDPVYYACNNGADDDGDGKVDYPADPGCSSGSDNDEYNAPPPPPAACADGSDNDGDGKIDLADPGCSSSSDNDEYNYVPPPPPAACGDGADNDSDGKIDLADPGCVNSADTDEYNAPAPPPPPPAGGDVQWVDWSQIGCTSGTVFCFSSPADRCAVKPNTPTMTVTGIKGKFENQCRFIPLKLNNVACLVRYPDVPDPQAWQGQMLQCWSNMKWTSPYVALQFNYPCQYTTVYYKFRIQGYGYVTTVGGRSFTSPTVESGFLRAVCH